MQLTDINDRLTPSVPIELTFGAQPIATGRKFTTLFAHLAAAGNTAAPYSVYTVVNVGDEDLAKAEVDAIAGSGSQAGKMAYAFVAANTQADRSSFPAFRICFIPYGVTNFGPNMEAINAAKLIRSDMLVSCYPAGDSANRTLIQNLQLLISGIDRDLQGQFGSFFTLGSTDALATAVLYAINQRGGIVAYLQDTNTALVTENGVLTVATNVITAIPSTVGINPGAVISGTGIPAGTLVGQVNANTVTMVDANNNPVNATATEASEAISFQNQVSQLPEIIAAAHAGAMMQSAFPYNPLTNVQVGGLVAPKLSSDIIVIDPNGASEQALTAGLSPLSTKPDGTICFIRTRTTYNLLPDGVTAVTAYFDWQDLVVMNDFREDCYQITQNPPFNGNPGGTKASQTIANLLKDEILREAQDYEDLGAFQGVQFLASQFLVQPSSTSRGRFDFKIPINVIPGLFVIAGNIEAVSGPTFGDFTL
jgi:hypothetical protein